MHNDKFCFQQKYSQIQVVIAKLLIKSYSEQMSTTTKLIKQQNNINHHTCTKKKQKNIQNTLI